ncbi:MAG: riboflavin synthase [Planctomycetota bacterium]
MFTGLVQTQSQIRTLAPQDFGVRLTVDRGGLPAPVAHGDSVCVSGVCLTAVEFTDQTLSFDVIAETLAKTKLGDLAPGDPVNLELAVTPQQPLGGHFMQGHVDGVGRITRVLDDPTEWRTTVQAPLELAAYLVPKGSVALDGVSLTLAAVHPDGRFEVALIPETLSRTTLGSMREGDRLNLEADILAKTVVHWLERTHAAAGSAPPVSSESAVAPTPPVTMDLLRQAGFAPEPAE